MAVECGRRLPWLELALLVAVAAVLGLLVSGHYERPHADVLEIWETGEALAAGRLPPSLKRAPVQPLLVAGLSRLARAAGVDAPAAAALAWLSALLLPVNVLLLGWLALRTCGSDGLWCAWWFLALPIGLSVTAFGLAEPLLTASILATLAARARGSPWTYPLAGLAALTRYDAAGLILGNFVADLLRSPAGRSWPGRMMDASWRGLLSSLPLLIWLGLTFWAWDARGAGHYLHQIAERPAFDPAAALAYPHRAALDFERLRVPVFLAGVSGAALRQGLEIVLLGAALLGLLAALHARPPWVTVAVVFSAGYLAVHTVFPFNFPRFGYPLAPLYLLLAAFGLRLLGMLGASLAAGTGAGTVLAAWTMSTASPQARRILLLILSVAVAGVILPLLLAQAGAFDYVAQDRFSWAWPLPLLAWLAAATVIVFRLLSAGAWPLKALRGALAAVVALVLLAHLRDGGIRVGPREDRPTLLQGAGWLLERAGPTARIASPAPGLFRYLAEAPLDDRFLAIQDVLGATPEEWLSDLRMQGVEYVLWHDSLPGEIGGYYMETGRFHRFAGLERPGAVTGAALLFELKGPPRVWIYRLIPPHEFPDGQDGGK